MARQPSVRLRGSSPQGGGTSGGGGGEQGPPGPGVAPGGAAGQVLSKNSTVDYDTIWIDPPTGGGGGLDQATADTRYVNVTGDAMTGALSIDGNLTMVGSLREIQNLTYIRTQNNGTGVLGIYADNLTMNGKRITGLGPPSQANDAATMGWVEGRQVPITVLSDVDTLTTPPTSGQVLSWNGTNWVPAAAGGGGGSVDWANVPAPMTVKNTTTADGDLLGLKAHLNHAHPSVVFRGVSGVVKWYFKDPTSGTLYERVELKSSTTNIVGSLTLTNDNLNLFTGKGIGFRFAGFQDTMLTPGSAAGILNINGKAIQTAAIREDGTEYGLADALADIKALKAELAELKGGKR